MSKPVYHLYGAVDVKKWRTHLYKEQKGLCALTGQEITEKEAVLDHDHKTHLARGVLHRQSNVVLGKIENMWGRYLKFWYNGTLPQFLRQCADYLEKGSHKHIIHPGWIKGSLVRFNKLTEGHKRLVLSHLGSHEGNSATMRKNLFLKALKSKQHTLEKVNKIIDKVTAGEEDG